MAYKELTEDKVRDIAREILGLHECNEANSGVGQITSFSSLGFKGVKDRPDGWYLPKDTYKPALILETKASTTKLGKDCVNELLKNCMIVERKYKKVVGILYNHDEVRVFLNGKEQPDQTELHNKEVYFEMFSKTKIDKQKIYTTTKKINDCLHARFKIDNLYHRMIFTACTLVAKRYEAPLVHGMNFELFNKCIKTTLETALKDDLDKNKKLNLLIEVFEEIQINAPENQEDINQFIDWVSEIANLIDSAKWNGEDVMGIFFNEFNRYKAKSESGQVFTPDHITSLMYRIIHVNKDDKVGDFACGSGAFLVKAMCNMINEAGGVLSKKADDISKAQLFGIEMHRQVFALACANMLIHKDGKTNLEQLDTTTKEASDWIKSKNITKVLMNPPFERKNGCLKIVGNVLDSVPAGTPCAFILPDKKLEKDNGAKLLKKHTLEKIIKLPEKTFSEGVTASVFIFKAGAAQGTNEIFACYISEDGLETVKNQGRQDIRNRWQEIEDYWAEVIHKQSGDDSIQWIKPSEHLSYQMPKAPFEICDEDFNKILMDYEMFQRGIDPKVLGERIANSIMYSSAEI